MADRIITLDNNFEVLYEDGLDGGGNDHLPDFINAVAAAGKTNYENAVEWCAGFGVIGFDFLNKNVCNNMAFVDCYDLAVEWLIKTGAHNKVSDKTSFYVADKISLIPNDVKWDLVLANPPHCFDSKQKEHFEKTIAAPQKDDIIRITCDEDFTIHKEFFSNIRDHLTPGADVFISEVGWFDVVESLALAAGLLVINRYPAEKLSLDSKTDAIIFHFKEPL